MKLVNGQPRKTKGNNHRRAATANRRVARQTQTNPNDTPWGATQRKVYKPRVTRRMRDGGQAMISSFLGRQKKSRKATRARGRSQRGLI